MYTNNAAQTSKTGPAVAETYFNIAELSVRCNLAPGEINDFIENKVISPDCPYAKLYSNTQLAELNKACRLKSVFGIEANSTARALVILENIKQLNQRKNHLEFACMETSNLTMQ